MALEKPHRIRDEALLESVRGQPCVACLRAPCDPCHVKSRGAGGPDVKQNVMPLCREHHSQQHRIGWQAMLDRYEAVSKWLESNGWVLDLSVRLWNPALERSLR